VHSTVDMTTLQQQRCSSCCMAADDDSAATVSVCSVCVALEEHDVLSSVTNALPNLIASSSSIHYHERRCNNRSIRCRYSYYITTMLLAATILINCICISDALIMPSSSQFQYNTPTGTTTNGLLNTNFLRKASSFGSNSSSRITATTTTSSWRKSHRRKLVAPFKQFIGRIMNRNRQDDTLTTSVSGHTKNILVSRRNPSLSSSLPQTTSSRLRKVQSFALSSSTSLQMVLSTPDTIIEQASTQKLLDTLIDESVRTTSRHPIMMQFNPKRGWIWRQWRGTVFSETWKSGLANMVLATFVVFLYGIYPNLKDLLQGFSILWGQLLSVTTFTLTFFLNQSYGLWRKCYDYSRRLQGRLNDLGLTLAAHATRSTPSSPDMPSTYTPQSRQALELVSRYVRVFNLLTYASFTRSHRPILTPRGMRRLVERGILTAKEREILSDAEVPATQRHNAVLIWLIRLFLEGRQSGIFEGGTGFEQQFMEKCHVIRAQYGAIGDELQGRMPLAYAHIVQVLLDVVLWMYPFMALSTGMAWYIGILGSGLLTMFYQGLFDLAKQFLDPYDNENYGKGDDPLVIDTLIAETNAGSVRWMNSFAQQPWSRQRLKDGELYDSILPQRGYTIEELMEKEEQEEKERLEKENARREKKQKDEERERERLEKLLIEHHPNIANGTNMVIAETRNGTAVLTRRGEILMDSVSEEGSVFDQEKKLIEISGGEIVAKSSLLPPGADNGTIGRAVIEEDFIPTNTANETVSSELESNKVLTLADGSIVTPDETVFNVTTVNSDQPGGVTAEVTVDNALPSILNGANEVQWDTLVAKTPNFDESIKEMQEYKASPTKKYLDSLSDDSSDNDVRSGDYELEDDFIDDEDLFDQLNFEWFDEIGEDGKEYRLSQMLADEEFDDFGDDTAADSTNNTMTYEEFTKKANELIEQAENELIETAEIMSSSPGSQSDYDAMSTGMPILLPNSPKSKSQLVDDAEPLYDQTRLDPISQLWGAPPDVLERLGNDDEEQQRIINEDKDFSNIYSLWGEGIPSDAPDEEETKISSPSIAGVSQLWDSRLSTYDSYDEPQTSAGNFPFEEFGVEWWDEVSDDGKEIRLSMMLADEEYEEEYEEEEDASPMTFEEFAEETEKLIEQAEEERLETEAIMNAPPNADFLNEDDDINQNTSLDASSLEASYEQVASSEQFEELLMKMENEDGESWPDQMLMNIVDEKNEDVDIADNDESKIVSESDISVLEMDEDEYIDDDADDTIEEIEADSDTKIGVDVLKQRINDLKQRKLGNDE
jgi:predicted membrane chloride channel (bestrophin family)